MNDLTTRPYNDADAAPLTELMNAIEIVGDGGHDFAEAEIRDMMSAWLRDAARDSRLVFASDSALVAAGLVSQPPPDGSHARTAGGVHPDWRGRGIGRALLSWQFERIAEIRAERGSTAEWIVGTGAGIADESAARLFRRFGLHRVRYFLQMRAPTAGVRPVPPPDGLRIAEYTADLRATVHGTHADAFADHWGFEGRRIDEWTARTVESDLFRADLSRIAFEGDQAVAFLLGYDGLENDLYIGQVGTRPQWRKRGLATALLAASLAAGAADGKTTASLGVDADSPTGAVTVYERLGFTAQHSPFAVYHRSLDRADLSAASASASAGR